MRPCRLPALRHGLTAVALAYGLATAAAAEPVRVGDAVLEPVPIRELAGFPGPDPAAALRHLRSVCAATPPATITPLIADLSRLCEAAQGADDANAATFFETCCDAFRVVRSASQTAPERRTGFLTGYFEPELEGSLERSPAYDTPVLARPDDLVSFQTGESAPGLDPALRAARQRDGRLEAYPDRAAIEDGSLGAKARPLLFLRDAVDLFVLQVQGSGRVHLTDGRSLRVLYDGRNGRAYTSVAKLIVAEGHLPLEGLTLARWTGWLRQHPENAKRLMRSNASYIFFRLEEVTDASLGPPGASKAALVPGRSIAVDAGLWPYAIPFWLEGKLPGSAQADKGRLVVAADTGSAIVGPARGDLFIGTGAKAGAVAGDLRDAVGFVVLLPKPAPPAP